MKVTLVNPPYPKDVHQHPPFIPLSLSYLGAVCERSGYEVNIIDCQGEGLNFEDFRRKLEKTETDVVGITSATLTYKSALKIACISKEVFPECVTILGGCHASFWDINALNECSSLDIIVRKEGEITFQELLRKLEKKEKLDNVQGITLRKGNKIIKNGDRPYIENLDDLPLPAYHLLNLKCYHKMGKLTLPILTSRGCVYWCNFCTAVRMFRRKYRMRSPKSVVDEIEYFHKEYGVEYFTSYDDAFSVDISRAEKICEEIMLRKLKIKWDCETRVDMVNKDLLEKMKKAGCIAVWFGVEAGTQGMVDKMQKKIKIDQTIEAFKSAHEVGLMTVACAILGFPGETEETAWKTVNFVKSLNPAHVGFYIATPFPGTPLYDIVKENGWLRIDDFDKYDTATPVFETPYLSMEKLKEIRLKAYQQFYVRPSYMFKMLAKGGIYGTSGFKTSMAYLLRTLHVKLS